jgi:hypothetical protein
MTPTKPQVPGVRASTSWHVVAAALCACVFYAGFIGNLFAMVGFVCAALGWLWLRTQAKSLARAQFVAVHLFLELEAARGKKTPLALPAPTDDVQ